MGRRLTESPPQLLRLRAEDTVHLVYPLKLITPQVGGSSRAGQPNKGVRPSSVASSLRSWWRVLNAGNFGDTEALFAAESHLWGSTSGQAMCQVFVSVEKRGLIEQPEHPYGNFPEYALFPFNSKKVARLVTGTFFTLRVSAPARCREQVDAAVRAFVAFGGLGARTRRGCGSIALQEGMIELPSVTNCERRSLMTALPGHIFLGTATGNPVLAWSTAVNVYRDFRQKPGFARNQGQKKPGRSRFPEADTIRRLTQSYGHTPEHPVEGYPRADLGLPILFHFIGDDEPPDVTLRGATPGRQRFASPVITKAVAVADNRYRPMVAILNSPHVWEGNAVELAGRGTIPPRQIELSQFESAQIPPMGGEPIRDALATYVQKHGFTQESL